VEHRLLWRAIEKLAISHGLTCSGLAKLCGLDATTFNKSKHFSSDGTPRWPSCNTISKLIRATNITMLDFAKLCTPESE
jgi:phage repressor protein C with HTH and peptisase S24 domain